jgi:CelD/BcsL family acetyltransferase involved in cellulose biosynthesis
LGVTIRREALREVEAEWRSMLPRCAMRNVFASPAWLGAWWEEFGDGRELVLLSARSGGELTGVLPLMRDGTRLTFAGDTEVCDYMDVVCEEAEAARLLLASLRSIGEEPWEELVLWAMPEGSATLAALPAVCAELGFSYASEGEDVCPQIELPGDWEAYLASLNKKDRHELRRKLRRLELDVTVQLEVLEAPEEIEAALGDFLRLHALSRAEKAAFMTEAMTRFFRRIVLALAGEALAEMVFLRLGGARVASVLCFRGEDEVLLYNSGYDPAYREYSVGLLSKALVLKKAIEDGRKRFDFLRGAEPYKYDLGARDVTVYRCIIRRP